MSDFHKRSMRFAEQVARAAAWMEKRNAGPTHWWKSWVLTERHAEDPDPTRPVFDTDTAKAIFKNLKDRNLLADEAINGDKLPTDEPGEPVHLMTYDREGWDKAVTDGRPIYESKPYRPSARLLPRAAPPVPSHPATRPPARRVAVLTSRVPCRTSMVWERSRQQLLYTP